MTKQIHGRLTDEQVIAILSRYVKKEVSAEHAMDMLELGRSQFFAWVKKYKEGVGTPFSVGYARTTSNRKITDGLEKVIVAELQTEKALIEDPSMPVKSYNYSYVKDRIFQKYQQEVSLPTIIGRAKKMASISKNPYASTMTGKW